MAERRQLSNECGPRWSQVVGWFWRVVIDGEGCRFVPVFPIGSGCYFFRLGFGVSAHLLFSNFCPVVHGTPVGVSQFGWASCPMFASGNPHNRHHAPVNGHLCPYWSTIRSVVIRRPVGPAYSERTHHQRSGVLCGCCSGQIAA